MSCSLQAMRDRHKCGLVLSTANSQFKSSSCIELCMLFLVETSLFNWCNCISILLCFVDDIDVLSYDKQSIISLGQGTII